MGQKQLLLIAVGIIIVGLAVATGISLASAGAVEANRDNVSIHLATLAHLAQNHYERPKSFGGGGETFANFVIPENMKDTEYGTFEHTQQEHSTDHIHFTGTGVEIGKNGTDPIQIEIRITKDQYKYKVKN